MNEHDIQYKPENSSKRKIWQKFVVRKFKNKPSKMVSINDDLKKENINNKSEISENNKENCFKWLNNKRRNSSCDDFHSNFFKNESVTFNTGRWTDLEHKKFLEAILIYGNGWKKVQTHISSRSSTQARSHAQKFFLRLKKNLKLKDKNPEEVNELNNDNEVNNKEDTSHDCILKFLNDYSKFSEFQKENNNSNDCLQITGAQKNKLLKIIYNLTNNYNLDKVSSGKKSLKKLNDHLENGDKWETNSNEDDSNLKSYNSFEKMSINKNEYTLDYSKINFKNQIFKIKKIKKDKLSCHLQQGFLNNTQVIHNHNETQPELLNKLQINIIDNKDNDLPVLIMEPNLLYQNELLQENYNNISNILSNLNNHLTSVKFDNISLLKQLIAKYDNSNFNNFKKKDIIISNKSTSSSQTPEYQNFCEYQPKLSLYDELKEFFRKKKINSHTESFLRSEIKRSFSVNFPFFKNETTGNKRSFSGDFSIFIDDQKNFSDKNLLTKEIQQTRKDILDDPLQNPFCLNFDSEFFGNAKNKIDSLHTDLIYQESVKVEFDYYDIIKLN